MSGHYPASTNTERKVKEEGEEKEQKLNLEQPQTEAVKEEVGGV